MKKDKGKKEYKVVGLWQGLKFNKEEGIFTGRASVFGNVDLQREVVVAGAFDESLVEKAGKYPILWQHLSDRPMGSALLVANKKALKVDRGDLDLDIEDGRRAYSGLKKGYLDAMSIGYNVIEDDYEDGIRYLKKIDLWEISIVTFPANPKAKVETVKSENPDEDVDALSGELDCFETLVRADALAEKIKRILSYA